MGWNDRATQVELHLHRVETDVCAGCFSDPDIGTFVRRTGAMGTCSYCGARANTVSIVELVEYMEACLSGEYDDAMNHFGVVDGDLFGDKFDTDDLFHERIGVHFPRNGGEDLLSHIRMGLGDRTWCLSSGYGPTERDVYASSWNRFVRVVKRKPHDAYRRSKFGYRRTPSNWTSDGEWSLRPDAFLEAMARAAGEIRLVRRLARGTVLVRAAQDEADGKHTDPRRLGPPPERFALQANRMNTPGTPALYAALELGTPPAEIGCGPDECIFARFELLRDVFVLDLTRLPKKPGLFNQKRNHLRSSWEFFAGFLNDANSPIKRRKRGETRAYRPTQVVSEYFRYQVRHGGRPIRGIAYPSLKNPGGTNVVLFALPDDVDFGDRPASPKQWLRFAGFVTPDQAP